MIRINLYDDENHRKHLPVNSLRFFAERIVQHIRHIRHIRLRSVQRSAQCSAPLTTRMTQIIINKLSQIWFYTSGNTDPIGENQINTSSSSAFYKRRRANLYESKPVHLFLHRKILHLTFQRIKPLTIYTSGDMTVFNHMDIVAGVLEGGKDV